jgi:hypothetical protein
MQLLGYATNHCFFENTLTLLSGCEAWDYNGPDMSYLC